MRILVVLVVLVPIVIGVGSIPARARAQGIDLSLSPPITQIVTRPGTIAKAQFTLTNHTKATQTIKPSFKPFQAHAQDGSIGFGDEEELSVLSEYFWLEKDDKKVGSEFTLRSSETAKLTLVLDIPNEATLSGIAGKDYYFTLLMQTKNKTWRKPASSKIEGALASNILLSLERTTQNFSSTHSARLKEFSTTRVHFGEPVGFSLRVENLGPHVFAALATITITDVRGKKEHTIALPAQNILAGSIRNLTQKLPKIPSKKLFGKYEAFVSVDIGGKEVLSDKYTFYVIPKNITIISIAFLMLLLIVFNRFRSYNKPN